MKKKMRVFVLYVLDRMSEPSTWQAMGFIMGVMGSRFGAGLDWGQAAVAGGTISAMLKGMLPDAWRAGRK